MNHPYYLISKELITKDVAQKVKDLATSRCQQTM
jgi:hypothetical protein